MTVEYLFLGAVGLAIVLAIAFNLYWGISTELTWAARVRRLLEQDGFAVQHMERRWFTKGPFPDLRPPGTKFHREWLVRVAGRDRTRQPRAGWMRWRPRRPWEAADKWAVRWDELPWSGLWDGPDAQKKGVSSRVFVPLVHGGGALGAIAGIFLVVQGIKSNREVDADPSRNQSGAPALATSESPSRPVTYEVRCRGGYRGAFQIEEVSTRIDPARQDPVVLMSLQFIPSATPAGADGTGLIPGTCAWLDRPWHPNEPRVIRFETPAVRAADTEHARPAPGSFPDGDYLSDATRYWSFHVYNTNAGFLQAASHRPLTK